MTRIVPPTATEQERNLTDYWWASALGRHHLDARVQRAERRL